MSFETISISDVKVVERFRKELGNIPALARSIGEVGLLQPIVVDKTGRLVAGRRRLEACKVLAWKTIPVHRVNLSDIANGEFHENAVRKNFTASEIIAIKRAIEPTVRRDARQRQGRRREVVRGLPAESAESRDIIAEYAGVSHDTLAKMERIVVAAEKDPAQFGPILRCVDEDQMSVNKAISIIRRTETTMELTEELESSPRGPMTTTKVSVESTIPVQIKEETAENAAPREAIKVDLEAQGMQEPSAPSMTESQALSNRLDLHCPRCGADTSKLLWRCCDIPFQSGTQRPVPEHRKGTRVGKRPLDGLPNAVRSSREMITSTISPQSLTSKKTSGQVATAKATDPL
jgi:hypothetical protein